MPGPRPAGFDYQTYLASREWALLKEQVRARSDGRCERCEQAPYQDTHHLTYERIGQERLEDLQAVCRPCHAFLSGKSDEDPALVEWGTFDPPDGIFNEGQLKCPACWKLYGDFRGCFLHVESASHSKESPMGSYGAATVSLSCEWGHLFDLVLADHKGAVFLSLQRVRRDPSRLD